MTTQDAAQQDPVQQVLDDVKQEVKAFAREMAPQIQDLTAFYAKNDNEATYDLMLEYRDDLRNVIGARCANAVGDDDAEAALERGEDFAQTLIDEHGEAGMALWIEVQGSGSAESLKQGISDSYDLGDDRGDDEHEDEDDRILTRRPRA